MDYRELLEQLADEDNCDVLDYIGDAVTAIENLMKYKDAVERMGNFGRLFVQYSGDPRGQMGHRGNRTDEIEDATMFSTIEDVEGDVWRPVLERVLQSLIQRTKKAERERDAAIADIGTYDLDRLCELVQADREGRCVVLPTREFFKALGDNVYIINYGEILETLLFYIGYNECGADFIEVVYAPMCEDEERFAFRFSDVGKTVFMTREAAEKALEEMEDE